MDRRRRQWKKLRGKYLFNEFALAKVFRARLLDAVRVARLTLPNNIPREWVVNCQYVGKGLPALKYLSRYLYRGVINDKNIIDDDGTAFVVGWLDACGCAFHDPKFLEIMHHCNENDGAIAQSEWHNDEDEFAAVRGIKSCLDGRQW